jgi:hypothetical protein
MNKGLAPSELIRSVLEYREITTQELRSADWESMDDQPELRDEIWIALQQWIADSDIRQRDPQYAVMKMEQLQSYLILIRLR